MHGIKKFAASAALVALSVASLAACGGENPTPTTAPPTATTAAVTQPATPTTAAVTEAPTATTGSTARVTPTTGSGGTGSTEALDVLQQSATAMKDLKSYHIVLESSAGGQSTTAEGDIEVPDKTRLVVETPQGDTEVIIIGDKAYTLLPGTDQYLETDSGLMGGTPNTNPAGFAQVAQDAEVVGDEQVDGADTTHVKFSFDLQAAAAASSQASGQPTPEGLGDLAQADAWIEKDTGFMRKLSYTAQIQGTDTTTNMTLSKFNETVDPPIEVPANVTTPGEMFGGTPTTP